MRHIRIKKVKKSRLKKHVIILRFLLCTADGSPLVDSKKTIDKKI